MAGEAEAVTAAVLVIGDDIFSGRTQDQNSHYIAKYLLTSASTRARFASFPMSRPRSSRR